MIGGAWMLQDLMPWLTAVTSSLLGGGILVPIVQHLLRRQDGQTRRMVEDAIGDSPTIRRLELEIYRQTIFRDPSSRVEAEHQLDVGRQYLALGGNGAGHLRLEQLEAAYSRRLETDDWDYTNKEDT